ncbi:hypothetical protein YQE_12330, partial [Dendroctonus ponderosae]
MCECTDMSMDLKTPRNVYLSAFYKRSFAYHTVKNRMPVILTQIIDTLSRTKLDVVKEFDQNSAEDLKKVISELSKFKYEIQTNKPLTKLQSDAPDIKIYNDYIDKQATEEGETTYFNTIWLLVECYMYRRIKEVFSLTDSLGSFDYFRSLKQEQFNKCRAATVILSKHLKGVTDRGFSDEKFTQEMVLTYLKANLWGNKCDLSVTLGKVNDVLNVLNVTEMDRFILVDDSQKFYDNLSSTEFSTAVYIDVVLDNAGYELITDLILMSSLSAAYPGFKVRFHVKVMPWFISDVTETDFHWTLQEMSQMNDEITRAFAKKCKEFVSSGQWSIIAHPFWTYPYEYKFMKELAPDLYSILSDSACVIFKGDLNYRKLFGEKNWDPTTPPLEALQGFQPSRLLTLRTIKADIVVGLQPGVAERCEKEDSKWMENGDYGVIHFIPKS